MKYVIPFLSGLLFGLGLLVSGMNDPQKVRAFLDVFGSWQPELIAVMGAAVVTFFIVFQLSKSRNKPLFASSFHLPSLQDIDLRLVAGAAMFGIGWGLVGLCPGPALVWRPGSCARSQSKLRAPTRKMHRKPKDSIRKKPGPAPQERHKPKDSVRK